MGLLNTWWTRETASNTRVLRRDVETRNRDARRQAHDDADAAQREADRLEHQRSTGPHGMTCAPAGWYADPWQLAEQRWWDGSAWTGYEHRPIQLIR